MPPTYSPWLKAFEAVGKIGFWRKGGPFDGLVIGDPQQHFDCMQDVLWRRYVRTRAMYDAWSPPPQSVWSAYTKPTLFAALDDFKPHPQRNVPFGAVPSPDSIGPCPVPGLDPRSPPRPPSEPRTAIVLDLPGEQSVAYGAWLARFGGHQPVALFNNWPHTLGLVNMTRVLGAMLYFAPWADFEPELRPAKTPPVFLLDRNRMGSRSPRPLDFDNRYFHNDSDLPSAATLRKHGIERMLYVVQGPNAPVAPPSTPAAHSSGWIPVADPPTLRGVLGGTPAPIPSVAPTAIPPSPSSLHPDADDLNPYLVAIAKSMPLGIALTGPTWGWSPPKPFAPRPRATPFNTTKDPKFLGYRRSAAGGFGKLVPEPSSGGG